MQATQRRIVAGVPDLFFASKIGETARRLGVEVVFAQTAEALERKAAAGADLVILDLSASALDPVGLIGRLKAERAPVVAFANHEQRELMEAARTAGCDRVMTRGAFSSGLPAIVAGTEQDSSTGERNRDRTA